VLLILLSASLSIITETLHALFLLHIIHDTKGFAITLVTGYLLVLLCDLFNPRVLFLVRRASSVRPHPFLKRGHERQACSIPST
jgi:hypothetical protein